MIPDELYDPSGTSLLSHDFDDRSPTHLVVGAPHHAPAGVRRLKCDRVADQNSGLLAWQIAQAARVPVVIVTNAEEEDPNKSLDSGYCEAVSSYEPNILFEVHGHGGGRACFDLEVSAGSSTRAVHAATFADALSDQMIQHPILGGLTVSADFDAIHYKARYTATMQTERWLGIHVDFPLMVRKRGNRRGLPAAGEKLAGCVATALTALFPSCGF